MPSRGTSVEIARPTDDFPTRTHQPHWPEPPLSALDGSRSGLEDRKDFADNVRPNHRDSSPRLLSFIIDLGERCRNLLSGNFKSQRQKKEQLQTITINDGMLRSRRQAEEAPEGLWQGIFEAIDALSQLRMTTEYGDYLAVSLDKYRGKDPVWKGMAWTDVAEAIEL